MYLPLTNEGNVFLLSIEKVVELTVEVETVGVVVVVVTIVLHALLITTFFTALRLANVLA